LIASLLPRVKTCLQIEEDGAYKELLTEEGCRKNAKDHIV
jgi:hypothetical protein